MKQRSLAKLKQLPPRRMELFEKHRLKLLGEVRFFEAPTRRRAARRSTEGAGGTPAQPQVMERHQQQSASNLYCSRCQRHFRNAGAAATHAQACKRRIVNGTDVAGAAEPIDVAQDVVSSTKRKVESDSTSGEDNNGEAKRKRTKLLQEIPRLAVIDIYWPREDQWFAGTIISHDEKRRVFEILYEDGELLMHQLADFTFRLRENQRPQYPTDPTNISFPVAAQTEERLLEARRRHLEAHAGHAGSDLSSVYFGVSWSGMDKPDGSTPPGPWKVQLKFRGLKISLGYYATEDDAARRYNKVVDRFFQNTELEFRKNVVPPQRVTTANDLSEDPSYTQSCLYLPYPALATGYAVARAAQPNTISQPGHENVPRPSEPEVGDGATLSSGRTSPNDVAVSTLDFASGFRVANLPLHHYMSCIQHCNLDADAEANAARLRMICASHGPDTYCPTAAAASSDDEEDDKEESDQLDNTQFKFQPGSAVEARYQGAEKWLSARVKSLEVESGTYHLLYSTGVHERNVSPRLVRRRSRHRKHRSNSRRGHPAKRKSKSRNSRHRKKLACDSGANEEDPSYILQFQDGTQQRVAASELRRQGVSPATVDTTGVRPLHSSPQTKKPSFEKGDCVEWLDNKYVRCCCGLAVAP